MQYKIEDEEGVGHVAIWKRTQQTEGTASAKVLRQACASHVQQRTKEPVWEPRGVEGAVFPRPPGYTVLSPGDTTSGIVHSNPWGNKDLRSLSSEKRQ